MALLEFLYAFPSPYTLGRKGNAKDDDGEGSMHTYIDTYANTGDVQHAVNMGEWTGMASGQAIGSTGK